MIDEVTVYGKGCKKAGGGVVEVFRVRGIYILFKGGTVWCTKNQIVGYDCEGCLVKHLKDRDSQRTLPNIQLTYAANKFYLAKLVLKKTKKKKLSAIKW